MTVNKVCGSGLKAVMLAAQAIALGDARVVVAGGMESMSNIPYLLEKARTGTGWGTGGDRRDDQGRPLRRVQQVPDGNAAELCAKECAIPRAAQDEFAVLSYTRARRRRRRALRKGDRARRGAREEGESVTVKDDEDVTKTDFAKIPKLKPAFIPDGTVTAANASKISDGAAALV